MPTFRAHIYGDVPVEVEIGIEGDIWEIGVLAPGYETGTIKVLYWLDLSKEDIAFFEKKFEDKIQEAVNEFRADERHFKSKY